LPRSGDFRLAGLEADDVDAALGELQFQDIEHLLELEIDLGVQRDEVIPSSKFAPCRVKSKRWDTSRFAWSTAFASSCESISETTSKEGTSGGLVQQRIDQGAELLVLLFMVGACRGPANPVWILRTTPLRSMTKSVG
jgi:hypothetical protein